MFSYQVDINMNNEKLIKSLTKLLNSDIVKNEYPMIDHVEIANIKDNPNFIGYDGLFIIFLNDPKINKNNMYSMHFDPHYLIDVYLKNLSKYVGIDFHRMNFRLYSPDGELILNWG